MPFLKQLTTRELEILSLLSQGYTNSSIADTLFIDIKTVEHHLNSMYSKLKSDPDYNTKHLRVSAARLYLEKMACCTRKKIRSLALALNSPDYSKKTASSLIFQVTTSNSKPIDGSRSLPGSIQAIITGISNFTNKNNAGI